MCVRTVKSIQSNLGTDNPRFPRLLFIFFLCCAAIDQKVCTLDLDWTPSLTHPFDKQRCRDQPEQKFPPPPPRTDTWSGPGKGLTLGNSGHRSARVVFPGRCTPGSVQPMQLSFQVGCVSPRTIRDAPVFWIVSVLDFCQTLSRLFAAWRPWLRLAGAWHDGSYSLFPP